MTEPRPKPRWPGENPGGRVTILRRGRIVDRVEKSFPADQQEDIPNAGPPEESQAPGNTVAEDARRRD